MPSKRKRSTSSNPLPTDLLSSLESSDRKAAKLRKSQISTETLPRSYAAKSQVDIQTNLMECRILMQRALTSVPFSVPNLKDEEDSDHESDNGSGNVAMESLDKLMSKLVKARRTLCSATLSKESSSETDSESDFDTDDEDQVQDKQLAKEYSKLRDTWKTTLNKHHANIHLQNQQNKNKFQVVDQSFWTQIENNVKHSAILDHANDGSDENENDEYESESASIGFDDSKLYQHMLKDYITLSAERGKDSAASAAAERLKRSMKNKNKKDVDRRASKGRKIRYVVHERLQNFTFPVSRGNVGAMDDDVLFKSMLGGVRGR